MQSFLLVDVKLCLLQLLLVLGFLCSKLLQLGHGFRELFFEDIYILILFGDGRCGDLVLVCLLQIQF